MRKEEDRTSYREDIWKMVKRTNVLTRMLYSLLQLETKQVCLFELRKRIVSGDLTDTKELQIDFEVDMYGGIRFKGELQLTKRVFWPECSLAYFCHSYDYLKDGENYTNRKPMIYVGFMDINMYENLPNLFYSTPGIDKAMAYVHYIYMSDLTLSLLNLKQIEAVTGEAVQYGTEYWEGLLKATTWEKIQMFVKKDNAEAEVKQRPYDLWVIERVRERCRARQEHYRILQTYEEQVEEQKRELQEKDALIAKLQAQLEEIKEKN